MSDDNPYRAPAGAVERIERRTRRPLGPISAGVVAMVLATVLLRGTGLPRRTSTRPPIELTRMTEQCSTLGCELPRVGRGNPFGRRHTAELERRIRPGNTRLTLEPIGEHAQPFLVIERELAPPGPVVSRFGGVSSRAELVAIIATTHQAGRSHQRPI
jgi:hypothetical protein